MVRNIFLSLVGLFFWCSLFAESSFRNATVYTIHECKEAVSLDGRDKEPIWKKSQVATDFTVYPLFERSKYSSKYRLCFDQAHLYLFLDLERFDFSKKKNQERDSKDLSYIEICFLTNLENKKVYKLTLREDGQLEQKIFDNIGNQDLAIHYKIEYAYTVTEQKRTSLEFKISLDDLGFKNREVEPFLFNISRYQTEPAENEIQKDEKKQKKAPLKKEVSTWSRTGLRTDNYYTFGIVNTVDNKLKRPDDQLKHYLDYAASFINSADVYLKAVNRLGMFVPEGTEVTHDASLDECDHIPIGQYGSKIEGYYRLYSKTTHKMYKRLANQILEKLISIQRDTVDSNGYHWIPLYDVVDKSGKSHGYDKGPSNTRSYPSAYTPDQSLAPLEIVNNAYGDAFGYGFWELSKNKKIIDEYDREKILSIIDGQLKFYNQPRLRNDKDGFYWQTKTIYPAKDTQEKIEKPKFFLLGQDIIYLYLAGIEMDSVHKAEYFSDLQKFLAYYLEERAKQPPRTDENSSWLNKELWRVEYVDLRAISAVKTLLQHKVANASSFDDRLKDVLKKSYQELPRVKYSEEGLTTKSDSTVLTLLVFDYLGHQNLDLLADHFLYYNFSYNGMYMRNSQPIEANMSTFSVLQYVAFSLGSQNKSLAFLQRETLFNLSDILNRKGENLDNFKWCQTEIKEHKKIMKWRAVPDRCYVENAQSEGVWKGNEKQAFLKIWTSTLTPEGKKYYENADSFYRLAYYQFTAPFQTHAEPFPFGEAMTFNMLEIKSQSREGDDLVLDCVVPAGLAQETPVFCAVDITDIVYNQKNMFSPTDLHPTTVRSADGEFIFTQNFVPEYYRPGSKYDHSKLVFAGYRSNDENLKIRISFTKTNKREPISLNDEN